MTTTAARTLTTTTLSLVNIFYLKHERVTKKMTLMVSPTFRRIHLLHREIAKESVADLRSATDPFTINVGDAIVVIFFVTCSCLK